MALLERQYGRWEVAKLARLNRLRPLLTSPGSDPGAGGAGGAGGCFGFGAAESPGFFFGRPLDRERLQELGFETRRHQSGRGFHTTRVLRAQGVVTSLYFDWTLAAADPSEDGEGLEEGVSAFDVAREAERRAGKRVHVEQDPAVFPFACELCDRRFTEARAVKEHVRDKHSGPSSSQQGTGPAALKCEECGKAFSSAADLEQHSAAKHRAVPGGPGLLLPSWKGIKLRVHLACPSAEEEDVYCAVCGQVFASVSALEAHVEDGTRPTEHSFVLGDKRSLGVAGGEGGGGGGAEKCCEDCGRDRFKDSRAFAQHRLSCLSKKAKRARADGVHAE